MPGLSTSISSSYGGKTSATLSTPVNAVHCHPLPPPRAPARARVCSVLRTLVAVDHTWTGGAANTVKGLEAKPLGETSLDFGPVRPGQSESGLALAALEKIKRQVSVDGVLVKHFFQDFEANQNSVMIVNHVTRQQFEQCISRLNFALSPTELDVLCKMFGGRQDGTVNYRQFVEYVDPAPPSIK
jgi:hypothetical protein